MKANIEIIVGTYEEFLLGYTLERENEKEVLKQSFADKSHSGALKCLAVQGRWIATGGTDDRIFVYDMKSRKQSQILLNHNGTVNALAFTSGGTHLLSGGDDGCMIAVRLNTWLPEATWKKAHNGSPVTHIACHPSGKLALSLGSDLVLCTWNLVKGRVAYKTNLKSKSTILGTMPDCLSLSPSGDFFTLAGKHVVEIWSIKTADMVKSQKTSSRPTCVSWINDEECLFGLEDGKILWLAVIAPGTVANIEAYSARVKAMFYRDRILVTAASSGEIKMWEVSTKNLKIIASINIGCRPTCIAILGLDQFGGDYMTNNKVIQSRKSEKTCEKTDVSSRERGIVTIEFDDGKEGEKYCGISNKKQNYSTSEEEQINESERSDIEDKDRHVEASSDSQNSTSPVVDYAFGQSKAYISKADKKKSNQPYSIKSNSKTIRCSDSSISKKRKTLPKSAGQQKQMRS